MTLIILFSQSNFARFNLFKYFVQSLYDKIRIVPVDAHRWFDAQNIAEETTFADEQTAILRAFHHFCGFRSSRFFRRAIFHELHAQHQTETAHLADEAMLVH